jgi:hypothetical protein
VFSWYLPDEAPDPTEINNISQSFLCLKLRVSNAKVRLAESAAASSGIHQTGRLMENVRV